MVYTANKNEFAKIVGISARQVTNWIAAGMPAEGTGKKGSPLRIDTAKAIAWLIAQADAKNGSKQSELTQERRRLVAAQARKAELQARQLEGELIRMEDAQIVVNEGFAAVAGQVRCLGSRLAGELANMTNPTEIRSRINSETDQILNAASVQLKKLAAQAKT